MRHYELAFFKESDRVFIPGILPKDRPKKEELPDFPYDEQLFMVFSVDKALPPNIVCRLIVRRHEEIRNETLLWRKGAVLYYGDGDATALITEDARNITVQVIGKDKTPYISSLRETLKDIFKDYKEIKPDLKYRVLRPEKEEDERKPKFGLDDESFMMDEDTLRVHVEEGEGFLHPIWKKILLQLIINIAKVYNLGNNTYGDGSGNVNHEGTQQIAVNGGMNNNSTIIEQLPTSVSEKEFGEILAVLEKFLKSPEAGKAIYTDDILQLQTKIAEASKLGHKMGWTKLREYLATAADLVTLATPIALMIKAAIGG